MTWRAKPVFLGPFGAAAVDHMDAAIVDPPPILGMDQSTQSPVWSTLTRSMATERLVHSFTTHVIAAQI